MKMVRHIGLLAFVLAFACYAAGAEESEDPLSQYYVVWGRPSKG